MTRAQRALTGFWISAGVMHFVIPRRYEAIVPDYVPITPRDAVRWSGLAEIVGGAAVVHPATRRFARWWILSVLVAVFPANIHMAVAPDQVRGLESAPVPRWALWARLPIQPLFALWAWRATE